MPSADGVFIRAVQPSDANLLLKWENDVSNWSVSNTKSEYSLGEIIDLIQSLEDVEAAKQARYMIIDKSSSKAIGAVDLFAIDFEEESASVGILVASEADRGRGIATAAIGLLEFICLEELGIENLQATVHENNISSVRLFEKLGFSKKKLTHTTQLNNGDYIETLIFEKCLKK